MLGWEDSEKCFFLLTAFPPVLHALWIFLLLRRSPRPIIESLASFVPGLQPPVFKDGMACLKMDPSADVLRALYRVMRGHQDIVTSDLEAMGVDHHRLLQHGAGAVNALGRRLTRNLEQLTDAAAALGGAHHRGPRRQRSGSATEELEPGDEAAAAEPPATTWLEGSGSVGIGGKGIWVNPKHLSRLTFVPTLFLGMYFWDATVITREASDDFPLDNCMGDGHCFYITQEYRVWRYPRYIPMDCEGMQAKTIASESGFYFRAPEDARFYKCYTWVFSTQNLIQATGDIVALVTLSTIVILYFCVEFTSTSPSMGSLEALRCQRRWCLVKQIIFVAVGVGSVFLMGVLYGRRTNDIVGLLGIPGLCFFAVTLFHCRRELLAQHIALLEKEDGLASDDSSGDDSDGPEGPAPPLATAPAGAMSGAAARSQPLLDSTAAAGLPLATAPAPYRRLTASPGPPGPPEEAAPRLVPTATIPPAAATALPTMQPPAFALRAQAARSH